MSYCKVEGKDKIIFATKEDHDKESSVRLPEPEEPVGLIKPNGDINWSCPCLGGMATGPCGVELLREVQVHAGVYEPIPGSVRRHAR
ncbi:hypothetical protein B566_EDAN015206 [Ephemera danica]|nr:hypothetical protein B566_EDAN015206 [Ephemera danica]